MLNYKNKWLKYTVKMCFVAFFFQEARPIQDIVLVLILQYGKTIMKPSTTSHYFIFLVLFLIHLYLPFTSGKQKNTYK